MNKNNVINYKNPSENIVTDVLSDFLKNSAQEMLKIAIESEMQNFIENHEGKILNNGKKQIVRNGYLPERKIQTGIGEVVVKVPRTRDRKNNEIHFTSHKELTDAIRYFIHFIIFYVI